MSTTSPAVNAEENYEQPTMLLCEVARYLARVNGWGTVYKKTATVPNKTHNTKMESKNKTRIPTGRSDAVLFEADRTCCICEDCSKPVQIHHIDDNPNNNLEDNLVVLCLDHHHEATVGSGIGRGLSPGQIRKYRKFWLEKVRARRENALTNLAVDEEVHEASLESLACHEIRRIHSCLNETEWDKQILLLKELFPYTAFTYGHSVRAEILYILNVLSDLTRRGMPGKVASTIENLAFSTMPIITLVHPSQKPISDDEERLLRSGIEIGFSISYDGIKYLRKLNIVAAGARILFVTLRYAHLNDLQDLKAKVIEEFNRLIDLGVEKSFEDAVRWLKFERDDALVLDGDHLPSFPQDIANKLSDENN